MPHIPLILVICLIATYALTTFSFVRCEGWFGINCSPINGAEISQINNSYSIADGSQRIAELDGTFNDKKTRAAAAANTEINCRAETQNIIPKIIAVRNQLKCKQSEIDLLEQTLINSKNSYDDANALSDVSAETKKWDAQVKKEERRLTKLKSDLTALTEIEKAYLTDLAVIRKQISDRYSSRLNWVFFTAVYILLCVGCLIVGFVVVFRSFESNKQKTIRSLGITAAIVGLFGLLAAFGADQYSFSIKDMLKQSIGNDQMPLKFINFVNVIGFAASAFLITASWSVLESVNSIEASPNETPEQKLEEYVQRGQYLKTILYTGTAMLIVGMLRMDSLLDWHKAFLSTENNNAFINLYDNFTKTLFSVEGGFFTLLLASVYLPAAYIVRLKSSELALTDENGNVLSISAKEQILKERGLIFSLGDFAPRLLVILSPLITGQIGELFKYLAAP
jgi:hypothetical protein